MRWPDSGGRDEVRLHPGGPGESAPRGEPEGEREKDQAARCLSPWGQGCGRSAGAGGGMPTAPTSVTLHTRHKRLAECWFE